MPEFRRKGSGSALMLALLAALRASDRMLVVYDTFSFLDSNAPAVKLYLRSGGRLEAEFLHLERWKNA